MQTFLPYPDFKDTFKSLDYRRLGKQRLEALEIYKILAFNKPSRWANHSAVKMWDGYTVALAKYYNMCLDEWIGRGYKNSMEYLEYSEDDLVMPWYINNDDFHRSMRSRLIQKNEFFYLPKFPNDKGFNNNKYLWPVNITKTFRII